MKSAEIGSTTRKKGNVRLMNVTMRVDEDLGKQQIQLKTANSLVEMLSETAHSKRTNKGRRRAIGTHVFHGYRSLQRLTVMRTVMLCSLLALMIAACDQGVLYATSFTEVATERTKLIDGIESYQSMEEAKRRFQKWDVIENSSLAPGDKRPPFSIHVVAIDSYSHLGHSGTLRLKFFNNRLTEARFYPSRFDQYVERLKESDKLTFKVTETSAGLPEAFALQHTHVWIYNQPHLDPSGKEKYVGWSDTRLEKEEALWIKRYS